MFTSKWCISFLILFPLFFRPMCLSLCTCHSLINSPIPVCPVIVLLSLFVSSSLPFPAMQNCVSGTPQGDPSTFRHEEDQPAEPDAQEPNPAGVCGARHPHLCWKPICGFYVLLLWDTEAPLHGHGVCGRWGWLKLSMHIPIYLQEYGTQYWYNILFMPIHCKPKRAT